MDFKPIETKYKGYRFRSRLEARWAVFFDAANIKYEYEPEGFESQDGTRYLPDFFLPEENLYVEVKGNRPGWDSELIKALSLVDNSTRCLMVLPDIPQPNFYWYHVFYYNPVKEEIVASMLGLYIHDGKGRFIRDFTTPNAQCPFSCKWKLVEGTKKTTHWINNDYSKLACTSDYFDWRTITDDRIANWGPYYPYFTETDKRDELMMKNAYDKARQARFEWGEHG